MGHRCSLIPVGIASLKAFMSYRHPLDPFWGQLIGLHLTGLRFKKIAPKAVCPHGRSPSGCGSNAAKLTASNADTLAKLGMMPLMPGTYFGLFSKSMQPFLRGI